MSTNNTAAPNRGIDDILQQTEMGSFISKNKSLAIAVVVISLLGVGGYGVWSWMSSKKNAEAETAIFEFNEGSLKSYSEAKIDADALVSGFTSLSSKIGSYDGLFATGIESVALLQEKGASEQALKILEGLKGRNSYQRYILATNLAVAYENLGKKEKALATLEELMKNNTGIMESKLYLDLGRLALELGQADKARSNLQWVIDKGTDAEMTLLARLYLSKLDN